MINLTQIKAYLGITNTSNDVRLQAILDKVNDEVVSIILQYDFGEYTIKVNQKSIKYPFLPLRHVNPIKLISINNVNVSALENGKDYNILENGLVEFPNLRKYVCASFQFFSVVYQAGWTNIPTDLIGLVANRVSFLFFIENGKIVIEEGENIDILKEKTGPREVTYGERIVGYGKYQNGKSQSELAKREFFKRLKKYIPSNLKTW